MLQAKAMKQGLTYARSTSPPKPLLYKLDWQVSMKAGHNAQRLVRRCTRTPEMMWSTRSADGVILKRRPQSLGGGGAGQLCRGLQLLQQNSTKNETTIVTKGVMSADLALAVSMAVQSQQGWATVGTDDVFSCIIQEGKA